jgi:hypothetical protein
MNKLDCSRSLAFAAAVGIMFGLSLSWAHSFGLEDPETWAPRASQALELAIDLQGELADIRWTAGDAEAWWAALTIGLGLDAWSTPAVSDAAVRLRAALGDADEAPLSDAEFVSHWMADVQDLVLLATYAGDPDAAPAGALPTVGWLAAADVPTQLRATLDRLVAAVARGRP